MADQSSEFSKRYAGLNPQQRLAVDTIEGPVLVVAGPGTGKTEVLAMRIANILQQTQAGPGNILCLTFTEAGVGAMRKRLQKIIGPAAYQVYIHTFHSFCNEVIQTFPDKFAEFSGNPRQVDDLLRVKIIRRILDGLDAERKYHLRIFHNPYYHQGEIIKSIQTLKREGVAADVFAKASAEILQELQTNPELNKKSGKPTTKHTENLKSAERNLELAEIYTEYQNILDAENLYDYEDMILFVLNRLTEDADLLAHYNEKFLYIHVDEYQDTNGSQNKLIKLLGSGDADDQPNIFAVGDDDQAIYRFQGANVDNLLFFKQNFREVQTLAITTNYRSSQAILDFAASSINHNQNRLVNLVPGLDKTLVSGTDYANLLPRVAELGTGEDEIAFVLQEIQKLVDVKTDYKDIAVLYRKHADAEDLVDAFLRAGVPIKLAAGNNALQEKPVQQLINLFRVIAHQPPEADTVLFEVLFYNFLQRKFEIPRLDVFKLINYVNEQNYFQKNPRERIKLFDALGDPAVHNQAGIESGSSLIKLQQQIAAWRATAVNAGLVEFCADLLQTSGLFGEVFHHEVNIDEANAVNAFFQFVKHRQQQDTELTLSGFLQDLHLLSENSLSIGEPKLELDENSVNLLTAHSAKGLEYKHVFVVKAYHGNWGGRSNRQVIKLPPQLINLVQDKDRAAQKELEQEDERRLFFVAVTRAKETLTVSYAQSYTQDGKSKEVEKAEFVDELEAKVYEAANVKDAMVADANRLQANLKPIISINLSVAEQAFLQALVAKFRLSASALNEYIACPLKFKFNRLLKAPLPLSTHIALGNAVHKSLELLGRDLMHGQQVTLTKVQQDFEAALNKELLGGENHQLTLTEGKSILEKYLKFYADNLVVPAAVEYNFSPHHVVLDLPEQEPIVLSGKIDKLEWVDQASNRVKIIDYKTSSPKSENALRGNTKEAELDIWRQLVFYQLLADLDDQFHPAQRMEKYQVDHVEVDFLKDQDGKFRKVAIEITPQDVTELKEKIAEVVKNIRALNFYGTEEYPLCTECEYCQLLS